MTPLGVLDELLARVGAGNGAVVFVSEHELSQWPDAAVASMKAQRLLTKTRPATSAVCPGCERECVMPVHVLASAVGAPAAFVVCDKRSDINRVAVPVSHLEQWQVSCELIADLLSRLLGLSRVEGCTGDAGRWGVGIIKGAKHKSRLALVAGGGVNVSLAGHTVPLAEVLALDEGGFTLDLRELRRLVDNPAAGGDDAETPEQRRERLRNRVREEKAKGTKAFLQRVAKEEGISLSRIKQLIAEESAQSAPANAWSDLFPPSKGASSKKSKPKC